MNDRVKLWNENHLEGELLKLSPRIQKDIKSIQFPKISKVKSSYLWGKVGSGKTIQAIFMLLSELKNEFVERRTRIAIFISIPELLFEFKKSYSTNKINEENKETEDSIVNKYSTVYLLVLDDFGVERITDWSFQLLYIIINNRYENMKKTIFTSNFSLLELAERLGDDRIPSRIQQMCEIVEFTGEDYRMKK